MSHWELFSSHGLVLIYFSRYPRARLRDAAEAIGLTERAVQNNIRDLAASGHLIIEKVGRRNRYKVVGRKHLTHPTTRSVSLRQLLQLFKLDGSGASSKVEKQTKAKAVDKTDKPAAATSGGQVETALAEPAIAEPPWNTADEIGQPIAEPVPVTTQAEKAAAKVPTAEKPTAEKPPVKKPTVIANQDKPEDKPEEKLAKTAAKKTTSKKTRDSEADDLPQQDLLF